MEVVKKYMLIISLHKKQKWLSYGACAPLRQPRLSPLCGCECELIRNVCFSTFLVAEEMYIENENYILRDNNSFGTVALFEKNKFGKKKYLFGFEYELSFEGDELLEITSINDKDKTGKEVAEYLEIILEMFNAVHKYIKEENSDNKMKSYKRIITKKISSL